ncbi:DUF3016 domain-containing protein [Paraglaciecola psychrophila]|uniref:DUF3016 domain-containing protein n=1 Tax=Paraglaciecola psychrophila 170 TaxID=1129794 RepID=K6ZL80_9ALTE|nr:DUF3016 domain-containing protein [Paraglaciecola psychrophila]AGH42842.1 hypothetical protein C427_0732 [Paraglaciecola psychrophila 170]GAC36726.1 hypothetical protein GPSY_1088 [Paraglaciecola psychrophila 170]
MKILTGLIISAMTIGLSNQVLAQAEVEIEWDKPEKYRDVRPSNESRKRFMEATFEGINEYMHELASSLPDNQKLRMKVTDLDLAGQVWPASFVGLGQGTSDVRVIKNIDIPRMNFSYQLLDTSGAVIQQADVDLKDMSFMDRGNRFFDSESLRYEKNMLQRWFKQEFSVYIDQEIANKEPVT